MNRVLRGLSLALSAGLATLPVFPEIPVVGALYKLSDEHFGSIRAGSTAGTVTLNPFTGVRTVTGGTGLGTSVSPARGGCYYISSVYPATIGIRANHNQQPFSLVGPSGKTIGARAWTFTKYYMSGTLNAPGRSDDTYFGLTLDVGSSASTPPGLYQASVQVYMMHVGYLNSVEDFSFAVVVEADLGLARLSDLRFGDIITGPTAGTVTLEPGGARSAKGGVTLGNGSAYGAATFAVTGTPGIAYSITLPSAITLAGGGSTLLVSSVTSIPATNGLLDANGTQTLSVGGTLQVPANQPDGDYTGIFAVTVSYN